MAEAEINVQCQRLSSGLNQLREIFTSDLGKRVLEVETNRESDLAHRNLRRLSGSLDQYASRQVDLVYVGALGHYSAGKSTTINSLLRLTGTENARDSGLHPTDKGITLLTHPRNINGLLDILRGEEVPIRSQAVTSDLLHRMVLSDTPGSGDPTLTNAMIRDFLPVCDLVLYFMSATNPLDEADVPLLKKKHERLRFIPTRFVLTRADVFKRSRNDVLSAENFDAGGAERFIDELIARMRALLPGFKGRRDDFFLIDNLDDFGVSKLRDHLRALTEQTDAAALLQLHSHKIDFFVRSARDLKDYATEFISEKVATVASFVEKAKDNIERYQGRVRITNNEMTDRWRRHRDQLSAIHGDLMQRIETSRSSEDVPESVDSLQDVIDGRARLMTRISAAALHTADDAALEIVRAWRSAIRDWEARVLPELTIEALKIGEIPPATKAHPEPSKEDAHVPYPLPAHVREELGRLATVVESAMGRVRTSMSTEARSLVGRFRQRQPLSALDERVNEADETLAADIESYFGLVDVYQAGVMSMHVRDYIARLGLGARLDALVSEMPIEVRDSALAEAREGVFRGREEASGDFDLAIDGLLGRTQTVLDALGDRSSKRPTPVAANTEVNVTDARYSAAVNQAWKAIEQRAEAMVDSLQSELVAIFSEVTDKVREVKKRRTRKIRIVSAAVFGVAAIGYALVAAGDWIQMDSPFVNVALGVLSGAVGSLLSWPVSARVFTIEGDVRSTREEACRRARASARGLVAHAVDGIEMPRSHIGALSEALRIRWEREVDSGIESTLAASAETEYAALRGARTELDQIEAEYRSAAKELHDRYAGFFSDVEANLEVLRGVSDRIKGFSIEPSFELLDETHKQLRAVAERATDIEFA